MSYENPTQVLDTSYGKLIKGIKAAEDNIVNRVKEKNLQQQKIQNPFAPTVFEFCFLSY